MITVLCVWVDDKYPVEYVERLRNMVARHLPLPHRFICMTDKPYEVPEGVTPLVLDKAEVSPGFKHWPGWWSKMNVFRPFNHDRRLYFDLDTVIVDDLTPLAEWDGPFGICENFTKLAGQDSHGCNYGSCVMSLAPGFGYGIFEAFRNRDQHLHEYPGGDQQFVEVAYPNATHLQNVMPKGYFLGYRDLTDTRPADAAIVVFAGANKPDNCEHQWIRDTWK